MARKAKGSAAVRVNFKGVESRRTPAEGDYLMKVIEATKEKSGAGNDQITFISEITGGEYKGCKLYLHCPLLDNSLWKLAGFLTALGEEVPEDEYDIDLASLLEKEFVGVVHHETYNGRKQARLGDFCSKSEYSGTLPEDEDGGKKKKKDKKSKKDEKSPSGKKDKKPEPDKKSKKEEPPAKGKKDKKPKVEKIDGDDVKKLDEKGLKALIKKHELDVDLKAYKNLKKQAAAVCDALEEKDLLAD